MTTNRWLVLTQDAADENVGSDQAKVELVLSPSPTLICWSKDDAIVSLSVFTKFNFLFMPQFNHNVFGKYVETKTYACTTLDTVVDPSGITVLFLKHQFWSELDVLKGASVLLCTVQTVVIEHFDTRLSQQNHDFAGVVALLQQANFRVCLFAQYKNNTNLTIFTKVRGEQQVVNAVIRYYCTFQMNIFNSFWHRVRLGQFWNKHVGERCVILGCGPSLRQTSTVYFKNEIVFGCNQIYQWNNFVPTYYVLGDEIPFPLFQKAMALPCLKFVRSILFMNDVFKCWWDETCFIFDDTHSTGQAWPDNFMQGVQVSCTAVYVMLQLAFFMGFVEVVLIGVDNTLGTIKHDHFSKSYLEGLPSAFEPIWAPRLFDAVYTTAKRCFKENGMRIVDGTVNGNLTIFDKVDYRTHFESNSNI